MTGHGDGGREPFARYREQLQAVGFRPSTARGQNFLLDPTLHRWIAEQADPTDQDTVIEIGVGLGFLTRELAARAGRVLAVEIEPRLLAIAQRELAGWGHVEWLEADALSGGGLHPRIGEVSAATGGGRLLVVANLPYSVSGPLLAELAQLDRLPDVAVVLVQKELAQRLAASPGERAYGGLAGLLQALFTVQVLRDVSPEVFRPRPKVWSSVVRLALREDRPAGLADAAARARFAQFVRVLFGQRRKTLRRTFAAAVAEIGGAAAVLPADLGARRAEQLTVDELVALWQRCEPDGFGPTD